MRKHLRERIPVGELPHQHSADRLHERKCRPQLLKRGGTRFIALRSVETRLGEL
jgi:hypothetical protein